MVSLKILGSGGLGHRWLTFGMFPGLSSDGWLQWFHGCLGTSESPYRSAVAESLGFPDHPLGQGGEKTGGKSMAGEALFTSRVRLGFDLTNIWGISPNIVV